MAWSYSSSTSSSNNTPQEKHEVFISFRSEDTRNNFTSHLNGALKRLDIRTYIDNNLNSGDEISTTLVRAIEEAELSVIVFSKNYAASKFCLDELMKILECKRMKGKMVVPIFYDVDPTDVRNQRGSYAEAFAKHEKNSEEKIKVQEWRNGLMEAANYSGWDCNVNRTELELVEEIAMDVLNKINRVYVGDLDHQIAKYEELAKLQYQFFVSTLNTVDLNKHNATVARITELKMERSLRLLRLSSDMLSDLENSNKDKRYPF
ncbi:putative TIR domain-containing protein [Medicago truncatula]|uniref:Disease resistance protein (TIR-NBS-LRR class) n=1 Tax=Medicago truncatula TaxID=3880 RepID=G7K8D4_MEDTR|nr:disease resistance protein RPV1 [Medicago truncatula]AES96486.1 disease resistance protein (TIR-NBS-LRR class) [Medicago truncatula]RHN55247.1 putative TIR domain-containing protein [Medicago truncatula]